MLDLFHPVRIIAAQDYMPSLVSVNKKAIREMVRPDNLQALGEALVGTPLERRLEAYTPYFIAMNVLNYQFWDIDENAQFQRYSHNGLVGALAMQHAMLAAWCDALQGDTGACLTIREQVARVVSALRSRIEAEGVGFLFGDIPAASSRVELLLEVLNVDKLTVAAQHLAARVRSTQELGWGDAQLLAYLFPKCYADRYLKKAQLTLMFIAAEFNVSNPDARCELNVTAAADYQLPKVARSLGVLVYNTKIANVVDKQQLIAVDSMLEQAIRAATILACDALAEQFKATIPEIDFWLWVNRNKAKEAQFHLTKTTAY